MALAVAVACSIVFFARATCVGSVAGRPAACSVTLLECVGLRSWPGPLGELQADEERDDEEDERFEGEQHQQESCWRVKPRTSLQITALASPEKVANECMKTWNRIALLNVTRDGNVKVDYQEGEVSRINLSGIAWLQGRRKDFLCLRLAFVAEAGLRSGRSQLPCLALRRNSGSVAGRAL